GRMVEWVRAVDERGRVLVRRELSFKAGEKHAEALLELPAELLNRLHRLDIEGQETAASVILVDERWRRRPVGLAVWKGAEGDLPLLSRYFYLERALEPFNEIRRGPPEELLKRDISVLVMADPGRIAAGETETVLRWVEKGGVMVRFAGPNLSESAGALDLDPLLPVPLLPASRSFGGAMTWDEPARLAGFDRNGPFHGLEALSDVLIRRQVLALPSLGLADRTWARLSDGTPLVTAAKKGNGWVVLFHTTANAEWSNLPLSGLFVEMLKRIVGLSHGVTAKEGGPPMEPLLILNGFARLGKPPAGALAIAADAFAGQPVDASHPPGFYGDGSARLALNLSKSIPVLNALSIPEDVSGVGLKSYGRAGERDLRAWLLGLAMALVVIDLAVSLSLRGLLPVRAVAGATLAVMAPLSVAEAAGGAGGDDDFAMAASLKTRLAYIITGDEEVDGISRAGLAGLSVVVEGRTAAELGEPMGVDPETDDMVFFPLVYWPLTSRPPALSELAASRVNAYLRGGGTILFDTRDRGVGAASSGLGDLGGLAAKLDIPPLSPIWPEHVLGRSFYLLDRFPGRWTGGPLWVERSGSSAKDGVSRIIAGGNDWAAAWAVDGAQRPLFAVVPGGERQREMAYRFGVNLVMYMLTGNYKSDQVHLQAIMERLGR
ncbi:MAG: DUF4159 domain-containing protein, partial [Rhodospirillales bacterium]